jgi:hypothetical protein
VNSGRKQESTSQREQQLGLSSNKDVCKSGVLSGPATATALKFIAKLQSKLNL